MSPKQLPTWAHGSVTGAGPHNGVRLELVAWPKGKFRKGQKVHLRVIGKATSGSSGSYSIHPTVALPRGLHNLEVLARSRVAVGALSFPKVVGARGHALAVDGSASTRPVTANIRMMALPKSALPAVPHFGVPLCAAVSRKIKELGPRLVDVGGLYSLMPDGKMQETYTAGSDTTLGVGISLDLPGDVGFSEEGTFTQTSSGAETFPAVVGKILNEQTPYYYGEYSVCGLMRQVQPEGWATGRNTVKVKPPSIDKCGENLGPGGTFTRQSGTAGTFKAGVDLEKEIGISLSAQSGYNKDVSIKYTAPHEGGYMCGSNNLPSVAAWDLMSPCDSQGHCVSSSAASIRAWARSRGTSHLAGRTRRSR